MSLVSFAVLWLGNADELAHPAEDLQEPLQEGAVGPGFVAIHFAWCGVDDEVVVEHDGEHSVPADQRRRLFVDVEVVAGLQSVLEGDLIQAVAVQLRKPLVEAVLLHVAEDILAEELAKGGHANKDLHVLCLQVEAHLFELRPRGFAADDFLEFGRELRVIVAEHFRKDLVPLGAFPEFRATGRADGDDEDECQCYVAAQCGGCPTSDRCFHAFPQQFLVFLLL